MLAFRKPTDVAIREYLASRRDAAYTYPHVGHSRTLGAPEGFRADRVRAPLGRGDEVYARGVAALQRWAMFPPQVVQMCWPDAPLTAGVVVGGLYRGPGLWVLLPCRIVYAIDEESPHVRRFGIGYGTLEGHWESGEERFLVEMLRDTGDVYYDLHAFSRPAAWLARLGAAFTRREQARFRRLSAEAMQLACGTPIAPDH